MLFRSLRPRSVTVAKLSNRVAVFALPSTEPHSSDHRHINTNVKGIVDCYKSVSAHTGASVSQLPLSSGPSRFS